MFYVTKNHTRLKLNHIILLNIQNLAYHQTRLRQSLVMTMMMRNILITRDKTSIITRLYSARIYLGRHIITLTWSGVKMVPLQVIVQHYALQIGKRMQTFYEIVQRNYHLNLCLRGLTKGSRILCLLFQGYIITPIKSETEFFKVQ